MTERPIECGHCRKQPKVLYQEVTQETTVKTAMCQECPVLEERLYGNSCSSPCTDKGSSLLCCASCLTTLDSIKEGNPLGCSNCYAVFGDVLIDSMLVEEEKGGKVTPMHVGKTPLNPAVLTLEERRDGLEIALKESLAKENYEEAARLRDQIQELSKHAE